MQLLLICTKVHKAYDELCDIDGFLGRMYTVFDVQCHRILCSSLILHP